MEERILLGGVKKGQLLNNCLEEFKLNAVMEYRLSIKELPGNSIFSSH
jgi:hypothetical protein